MHAHFTVKKKERKEKPGNKESDKYPKSIILTLVSIVWSRSFHVFSIFHFQNRITPYMLFNNLLSLFNMA